MIVEGHRQYNPGWHLALDLRNMLIVSECIAKAALAREESRGGHTRDDFPATDTTSGAPRTWWSPSTTSGDRGRAGTRSRCRRCRTSSKKYFETRPPRAEERS